MYGLFPIVATDLAGDAYARGHAYGTAFRSQIRAHLSAWLESLESAGFGEPNAYIADMLRETNFTAAVREHVPDLFEEVRGTAVGAEQPAELVFALQLMDEEWAYRRRRQPGAKPIQKCSSVAIASRQGPTWIGQNMDLGGYTDGHQVLLGIASDGSHPGALVFSIAGMIGLLGVNSSGVGVCVNALPQLPSASEGVPVAFVVRRLLQARSLAEATGIVCKIPHASNQHYLIAASGAVRSFEASAAGVTEYHPPNPSRVVHTNHPLAHVQGVPEPEAARASVGRRSRVG